MKESESALEALGAHAVEILRLGMPDTGLADREGELTEALKEAAAGFQVCLAPWEADVHSDHEAAGRAAVAAGSALLLSDLDLALGPATATCGCPGAGHCGSPCHRRTGRASWRPSAASPASWSPATAWKPCSPPGILAHFTRDHEVLFR